MTTKEYIDSLFTEYEEGSAMKDFKEEMLSNLEAHIANLKSKGLSDSDAFNKATAELGDVKTLANEISLKKKQEVYETMYMKTTRSYISRSRRIAYIACLGIFLFGALVALMMPKGSGMSVMLIFGTVPIAWATYLLLTQETMRLNPMRKARACVYGVAVLILSFGFILFLATYMRVDYFWVDSMANEWSSKSDSAFAVLLPFGLPSVFTLAYLFMTEQSRTKAWVTTRKKDRQE